jgi:hypothetical protein
MDIGNIKSYLSPKEFQILFNGILQVVKTQIDERNLLSNNQSSSDYELLVEKLKTLNQELDGNDVGNIIQAFEMVIAHPFSPISFDLYFCLFRLSRKLQWKIGQTIKCRLSFPTIPFLKITVKLCCLYGPKNPLGYENVFFSCSLSFFLFALLFFPFLFLHLIRFTKSSWNHPLLMPV